MTPEARAALKPDDPEYALRVGGSKNQICGWMVYTSLLWTLKTCMLIFFSRLTYAKIEPATVTWPQMLIMLQYRCQ